MDVDREIIHVQQFQNPKSVLQKRIDSSLEALDSNHGLRHLEASDDELKELFRFIWQIISKLILNYDDAVKAF